MDANPSALSKPGTISQAGDSYKKIHSIAKQQPLTIVPGDGTFAVAVLQHDKLDEITPANFFWFKVKGKHSVKKVRAAYEERADAHCVFKFDNSPISDSTQMRRLDCMNDSVIVFTAHKQEVGEEEMDPANPTPSSFAPSRTPLQPTNTQLPANPSPLGMDIHAAPVKTETANMSLYEVSENVTPPANVRIERSPRPYGPVVKNEAKEEQSGFSQYANAPNGFQTPVDGEAPANASFVKQETVARDTPMDSAVPSPAAPEAKQPSMNERFQKLISEGTPEELEAEVKSCQAFLRELRKPLEGFVAQNKDAHHWVAQIEQLQKQNVDTPTIIGVVGNTGAGKSSVINALLEEERLVPTNCMRACTAVVTEMSYNHSDNPNALYRADIEFIQASDWEKDLRISLKELIDANGQVSRECTNPESEAGVAYAKIKAVYPSRTRDDLAHSSVEDLMKEDCVRNVLGTIKKIEKSQPEYFYRALQSYVDSKEKSTEDKSKKKEKGEKKQMEFWPLIKVVRIYTKAEALSTGAVIVDLPGVHDSNAARAAVAQGYMKQCTELFIVAPINRAVDDKAAKSLLGESFKRQLKFDGTYSRITFICSKTDDISITEASDSLGLEDQMSEDWDKIDAIEKELKGHKQEVKDLKESKGVFTELINDAEEGIELWEKLKDQLEDGETVYDPSKKRKRSAEPKKSRKKAKKSRSSSDDEDEDDFIVDEDEDEVDDEDANSEAEIDSDSASDKGDPLTAEDIDAKITQLKDDKKRARRERIETDDKIKEVSHKIKALEKAREKIDTAMSAICIAGRNNYSKGAIQRDFADGIRELDMESAQEEDPDRFNPEDDLRDYDEVARSLPVFCVSSRAYQKIQGRLQRDKAVPGFRTAEETEIPQLQAHCKKLTEAGRASNCRNYLTNLSQLLNSLGLWASNDGIGLNLTDVELAAETKFLKLRLQKLEQSLDKAVMDCLKEMNDTLAENIFEHYEHLVELAVAEANNTVGNWHRKVNRDNRALGGYYWATYKAIVRREGVFSNAQGTHDFNAQLTEPIIKHLASHWEKTFAQRLPRVLSSFSRQAKDLLTAFHREIELRTMKTGSGSAGVAMLGQQLKIYEQVFATLATQMLEMINGLQREANREFTPVIARNLSTAYDYCANESGGGCFNRMKAHMSQHIDHFRGSMFSESCEEVKGLLLKMCKQVSNQMSEHIDVVFIRIERDYLEVISGTQLPGQTMPKWERHMRAGVAKVIEDRNQVVMELAQNAAAKKVEDAAKDAPQIPGNNDHEGGDDDQSRDRSPAPQVKCEVTNNDMDLS
ncbi:Dynamin family-domain-containing protein [Leptodontidium sp. MPI-SDFR-AT-0119]|nr:Dynamin family-domain-containing protein [Leptodontidium sp. MPI-SDFR-AT-0119]